LQVPLFEQSPLPTGSVFTHRLLGSAPPDGTAVQLPSLLATRQLMQRPDVLSVQAVSQHTPSVQFFD